MNNRNRASIGSARKVTTDLDSAKSMLGKEVKLYQPVGELESVSDIGDDTIIGRTSSGFVGSITVLRFMVDGSWKTIEEIVKN